MSQSFLTAFNNLVIKFNDDLIETFPEETDFKVYKHAIVLLNMANAKKICKLFKNYMLLYRIKIENEDETFFLNTNYIEIVEDSGTEGVESIILKLKHYWNTLSSGNKIKVWGYLNSLIKLSDMIN